VPAVTQEISNAKTSILAAKTAPSHKTRIAPAAAVTELTLVALIDKNYSGIDLANSR
jgi:hypothetical protein